MTAKKGTVYRLNKAPSPCSRHILLACMFAFFLTFGLGLVHHAQISHYEDVLNHAQVQNICVHSGDTLYEIAGQYTRDQVPASDAVHWIRSHNKIENGTIYPGQTISVPVL